MGKDKRKDARVELNVEASYKFMGNIGKCTIVDISRTGVGLRVKQILDKGDILDLSFNLPNGTLIECKVEVKFEKTRIIGCVFVDIDQSTQERVDRVIDRQTNSRLRKLF